jgi:hypothetical protein
VLEVPNETMNDKYLGLPTDVGRSKNGAFGYLKDRIWKRVQGCMEKKFSGGGKEILIKSVLQAIPTFSMALFKLPRGLCDHITSMVRKFWWGSKNGERKAAWVSWESMTMPKYRGGLGFRDIELFNLALLARQVWRILIDPESLSARVHKAVYFPNCNVLEATLDSRPSQIWRSLCDGQDILQQGLIRRIGDGTSTGIWDMNWIPRDFKLRPFCSIARNPPQLVSELICSASQTWKMDVLRNFFMPMDIEAIKGIPISHVLQIDCWAWHYDRAGLFFVRSAYKLLAETKRRRENYLEVVLESSNTEEEERSWKKLWKVVVPSKLRLFAWRLARSSLPMGEVRAHRHMANSPRCPVCNAANDTWIHSLLECDMAHSVWVLREDDLMVPVFDDETTDPKLWLFALSKTTVEVC